MDGRLLIGLAAISLAGIGAYFLLKPAPVVDASSATDSTNSSNNSTSFDLVESVSEFLGMGQAIGIKNNNPLNLRWDGVNNWQGLTGQDSHGFCVFDTPVNGIRAAAKNLDSYIRTGENTINLIISRWAPAQDNNNVPAYIDAVEQNSGIDRNSVIVKSRGDYVPLLAAMIRQENGSQPYSLSTIQAGVNAS